MNAIEDFGLGLLNVLWDLSQLPALLASFALIIMLGQRLSARMPGPQVPERDLRVARVILSWPDATARAPWKIWLLWVALLCLITVPGATYAAFSDDYDSGPVGLIMLLAPLAVGGLTFFIVATWIEWLARVAAMRRQPALVLLAPAALIGGYAIVCRVIGPAPVDTALLTALSNIVVLVVLFVIVTLVSYGGLALGGGVLVLVARLLWWPFGRVVRWWRRVSAANEK